MQTLTKKSWIVHIYLYLNLMKSKIFTHKFDLFIGYLYDSILVVSISTFGIWCIEPNIYIYMCVYNNKV
jgi:hypothetical protein